MSQAIRVRSDPIRTLAFSLISGTYYGVGTELSRPARNLYILNDTDRLLTFSFDGVNDHIVLPSLGYWFYDITSNKSRDQGFYLAEGERLYVKTPTTSPTTGAVYFTVMYGAEL